MTGDTWFSSRLRFAIIIETLGPVRYDDSVYLLRSTDFEAAFQRALETGRKNQKEYLNGDGQKVNATRFSNTGNRLRQLWGRPPGLPGSPKHPILAQRTQPYPRTKRPTWTSAAGLESRPTNNVACSKWKNEW